MQKTASNIRAAIKAAGFNRNDVSVACRRDYTIHCRNISGRMGNEQLLSIVEAEYYKKSHAWLCVFVNAYCLPFEKPKSAAQNTMESVQTQPTTTV